MICICSEYITPRLEYTLDFIFKRFFLTDLKIINCSSYNQSNCNYDVKIYYGHTPKQNFLNIPESGILKEQYSHSIKPNHKIENNKNYLFYSDQKGFDINFDIFGAVFFMISRYEEYNYSYNFSFAKSVAYKNNFLDKPIVNIWLNELKTVLIKKFKIKLKTPEYKFISTIDIDNAYAYKNKTVLRQIFSTTRFLLREKNFKDLKKRLKVNLGKEKDPYDTYEYILELHKKYDKNLIFFVQLSNYGKFDKNINYKNKNFRNLIKNLSKFSEIGIHPGHASNFSFETLKKEVERLKKILSKQINKSRQHYLMLKFPDTYRNLIKVGIKQDFTMGFSNAIGYRAGTTLPFEFYDLNKEKKTELTIYPFTVMDVALNKYMMVSPGIAMEIIIKHINITKKYGGYFISAWHNESLSEYREWKGWRKVFEQILKYG